METNTLDSCTYARTHCLKRRNELMNAEKGVITHRIPNNPNGIASCEARESAGETGAEVNEPSKEGVPVRFHYEISVDKYNTDRRIPTIP